jgi:cytochrome P450
MKPCSLVECVAANSEDIDEYYTSIHRIGGADGFRWDESINGWLGTSHSTCVDLLNCQNLGKNRLALPLDVAKDLVEAAQHILNDQMMVMDGAGHDARRKRWMPILRSCAPQSSAIAKIAVDSMPVGPVDVRLEDIYAAYLQPYASRVISYMLGLTELERVSLFPFITAYVRFLDGKLSSEKEFLEAMYAVVYLYDQLSKKSFEDVPEGYRRESWLADMLLMLIAGHESTAYLLGTALIQGRRCLQKGLERAQIRQVVQEALRFDSPVQLIGRVVKDDVTLHGKHLRRNEKVFIHIGAANRDPNAFENAGDFVLRRQRAGTTLYFGAGPSACPGQSIAAQSAQVFLDTLLQANRWLDVDIAAVRRRSGIAGRGFACIPAMTVHLWSEGASANENS